MRIPEKISICGVSYRVKQDPTIAGGSFDTCKAEIVIGTAVKHDIPDTLLHEIIECVYSIRNMRYTKQVPDPDNGDYVFHYDHEAHHHAVADIAAALKGISFK